MGSEGGVNLSLTATQLGGGGRTGLSATRHLGHTARGHQSDLPLDTAHWPIAPLVVRQDPNLLLLHLHGAADQPIAPLRLLQDVAQHLT